MRNLLLASALLLQIIPGSPFGGANSAQPSELTQYKVQVTLSAADILALSGGTKVILAAVPGKIIVPTFCQFDRQTGTAYTAGSVTNISISYSGQFVVCFTDVLVLTGTGPSTGFDVNTPNSNVSVYAGFTATQIATITNLGVVATRVGAGDVTGGTGSVIFTMWYRLFPVPAQ